MEIKHRPRIQEILKQAFPRFIPQINVDIATFTQDTQQATDLVINTPSCNIGCRVREYSAYVKYPEQFTIRSRVYKGGRTELDKILEGCGDYNFYAFENEKGDNLIHWFLYSLDIFRQYYKVCQGQEFRNPDGSYFKAFKVTDFPANFIVCSKARLEQGNILQAIYRKLEHLEHEVWQLSQAKEKVI